MNIKYILPDDGYLYIEVPSVKCIRKRYKWDFLLLLQNAHTYHFTLRSLTNVMGVNGFECIAGDEFTRSIFIKTNSIIKYTKDYKEVMHFLKFTNMVHPLCHFIYKLSKISKSLKSKFVKYP